MENHSRIGSVKTFKKSQIIFDENTPGSTMYILRKGKVKIVLGGKDGVEVGTVEEPGDFFGEMALIDGSLRSATTIVEEDDTEIEVLDRDGFLGKIKMTPEFALQVMHELSERVRLGNSLYLEVVKEAMSPFCRQNCLGKTLDAFARRAMSGVPLQMSADTGKPSKWRCVDCDYVYVPEYGDPDRGIPPGTAFEQLPDDWQCPECGAPKSAFQKVG